MTPPRIELRSVIFPTSGGTRGIAASHPVLSWPDGIAVPEVGLYYAPETSRRLRLRLRVERSDRTVRKLWIKATAIKPGAIGDVAEAAVTFGHRSTTAFVNTVAEHRLGKLGVSRHEFEWQWWIRFEPKAPFERLGTPTRHVVYRTLGKPTAPWGRRRTNNIEMPWNAVLDLACVWASETREPEEALKSIASAVRELPKFAYDPSSAAYADPPPPSRRRRSARRAIQSRSLPAFNCSLFLLHLKDGQHSQTLDCSDVASIVSTFGNILGADVSQDAMFIDGGAYTRPVKGIGWQGFRKLQVAYHEVAWKSPGKLRQPLWDAALLLDDGGSGESGYDIPFIEYRPKLMGNIDPKLCYPDKDKPLRRRVRIVEADAFDPRKGSGLKLTGWTFESGFAQQWSTSLKNISSFWLSEISPADQRMLVNVIECSRPSIPSAVVKHYIYSEPGAPGIKAVTIPPESGEEAYANSEETLFYLVTGRNVVRVRSSGIVPVSVRTPALEVGRQIQQI